MSARVGPLADALRFEAPLAKLRQRADGDADYFGSLVRRLLLDNPHCSTVELRPDPQHHARQAEAEMVRLAVRKSSMAPEEVAQTVRNSEELRTYVLSEDTAEDRATVPRIRVRDLRREVATVSTLEEEMAHGGLLLSHAIPTAGVIHADVLLDLSAMPLADVPLLPLLCRLILEVGTPVMTAAKLQRRIGAQTGGLSASVVIEEPMGSDRVADPTEALVKLAVRGRSTRDGVRQLFDLMRTVLVETELGGSRAKVDELLRESRSEATEAYIDSGGEYAAMALAADTSLPSYLREVTAGLAFHEETRRLLETAQDDWCTAFHCLPIASHCLQRLPTSKRPHLRWHGP